MLSNPVEGHFPRPQVTPSLACADQNCTVPCTGPSAAPWGPLSVSRLSSAPACALRQAGLLHLQPRPLQSGGPPGSAAGPPVLQPGREPGQSCGALRALPITAPGFPMPTVLNTVLSYILAPRAGADGTVSGRKADPIPVTPRWPEGKSSQWFQQVDRAGWLCPLHRPGPRCPEKQTSPRRP